MTSVVADDLRDPDTGLFNAAFFDASVPSRLASAKRALRPLSIVLLTVRGSASARSVGNALVRTLRGADLVCALPDDRFGLVLDETAADGAVLTVDKVRGVVDALAPDQRVWAGVATYPTHALEATALLMAADAALRDAMGWAQSRIELAIS